MARRFKKIHQTEAMRRSGGGIWAKIGPNYGKRRKRNRGRKSR